MNWLKLRYTKRWYVVTLDDIGHTVDSRGPYRWPKAKRLRDRTEGRCIIRRTP